MSFAKLDKNITKSSLWISQPEHIRCVWFAFLAEKDENGYVAASYQGMRHLANLFHDEDGTKFDEAIKYLEGPDYDSRTPDFEGRRIKKIDGGWIVLNHEKYKTREDVLKEQNRQRVEKHRKKLLIQYEPSKKKNEEQPEKPEVEIPAHLKENWPEFLEMRKKIRKPPTIRAQQLLLNKLAALSNDNEIQKKIVEQSIENSWQGFFPLKTDNSKDNFFDRKQQAIQQEEDERYRKNHQQPN